MNTDDQLITREYAGKLSMVLAFMVSWSNSNNSGREAMEGAMAGEWKGGW